MSSYSSESWYRCHIARRSLGIDVILHVAVWVSMPYCASKSWLNAVFGHDFFHLHFSRRQSCRHYFVSLLKISNFTTFHLMVNGDQPKTLGWLRAPTQCIILPELSNKINSSIAITNSMMHAKVDACGIYAAHHPDHPRRSCDHVLSVFE